MDRKVNKAIWHCTATPEGRKVSIEEITSWHKKRGFLTVGYHLVVHLDGSISRGRSFEDMGAHCRGQNADSIGIVYVGGCDKDMNPKDTRTPEQKHAMKVIREYLDHMFNGITHHGHYEFAAKACPSFLMEDF